MGGTVPRGGRDRPPGQRAATRPGATLDLRDYFEVSAATDHAFFIRSLRELLPANSALYFEGTTVVPAAIATFERFAPGSDRLDIARGTIAPTPKVFHACMTDEALNAVAELFENHASPEICDHFHAYHTSTILLQWHDAFFGDPFLLAGALDETTVARFCAMHHCEYIRKYAENHP